MILTQLSPSDLRSHSLPILSTPLHLQTLLQTHLHELSIDFEVRWRFAFLLRHSATLVYAVKEMFHSSWNDANLFRADVYIKACTHRVCLTGASLQLEQKK